jgi:hypothetical protein
VTNEGDDHHAVGAEMYNRAVMTSVAILVPADAAFDAMKFLSHSARFAMQKLRSVAYFVTFFSAVSLFSTSYLQPG